MSPDQHIRYSQQLAFIDERTKLVDALLALVPSACSTSEMSSLLDDTSVYLQSVEAIERRHKIRATNLGGVA